MMEKLLLRILSDHLAGRKTDLPFDTDLSALTKMAKEQQVDAIVYAQCPDLPDPSFATAYSAAVFYYVNRKHTIAQIQKVLRQNGIDSFLVKGFCVARYYPVPELRTMGDCDFIMAPEDTARAAALMELQGFHGAFVAPHEWVGTRQWMCFEIHGALVNDDERAPAKQQAFFNDYSPYLHDGELDPSFHFLYLIEHLRKHFLNTGVGIRPFFDLAVIIQNAQDLRWQWINETLQSIDLMRFARVVFSLLEAWFGVRAPIIGETLDPALEEEVRTKIFKDGAFGKSNEENERIYQRDVLRRGKGPLFWRRIVYFWHNLFPSYESMKEYRGISYLDGRPYLLPLAYLHRFALLLFRRDKKQTLDTVSAGFMKKEELSRRQRLLRQMGLDEREI